MKIELVTEGLDTAALSQALSWNEDLWGTDDARTNNENSPHYGTQDIWCRWAKPGSGRPDGSHESMWYPAAEKLPVSQLCDTVLGLVGGGLLGGVLITRIPPGESVKPHKDSGWHAGYYEKFAVQIAGNEKQAFKFHGEELVTKSGDLFRFDNSHEHWVTNDSDEARITLIICIRRN